MYPSPKLASTTCGALIRHVKDGNEKGMLEECVEVDVIGIPLERKQEE